MTRKFVKRSKFFSKIVLTKYLPKITKWTGLEAIIYFKVNYKYIQVNPYLQNKYYNLYIYIYSSLQLLYDNLALHYYFFLEGTSAYAGPHYHKLYGRVIHVWDNRRGQPKRSAMQKPRSGRSPALIRFASPSGKYELRGFELRGCAQYLLTKCGVIFYCCQCL